MIVQRGDADDRGALSWTVPGGDGVPVEIYRSRLAALERIILALEALVAEPVERDPSRQHRTTSGEPPRPTTTTPSPVTTGHHRGSPHRTAPSPSPASPASLQSPAARSPTSPASAMPSAASERPARQLHPGPAARRAMTESLHRRLVAAGAEIGRLRTDNALLHDQLERSLGAQRHHR